MVTYKSWFAIWVNFENCVFLMRRTKRAAKQALRDARHDFPSSTFGMKRLIESIPPARKRKRRRTRKPAIPKLPDGFSLRTTHTGERSGPCPACKSENGCDYSS